MKTPFLMLAMAVGVAVTIHGQGVIVDGYTSPVRKHIYSAVLIELPDGRQGSGFLLSSSNTIALATAKHVLFDPITGKLRQPKASLLCHSDFSTDAHAIWHLNLEELLKVNRVRAHQTHDVAVVIISATVRFDGTNTSGKLITTYGKESTNLVTISAVNGGRARAVGEVQLRKFSEVMVGDDAFVFGYPGSLGLEKSPRFDYKQPLIRKGLIAGKYKNLQTIIVDSPVYFGNSGGPVLEVEQKGVFEQDFRIIGVVSEMIPFVDVLQSKRVPLNVLQTISNSGYCVVEPVDFILELLK